MIYTFYSYKGGVGRSMALVNVAELMYRAGRKVIMVDWDLEAPGLERYYPEKADKILGGSGVVDLLINYKDRASRYRPQQDKPVLSKEELKSCLIDLYSDSSSPGKLQLLPAGRRADQQFVDYATRVKSFDWQDFYQNWEGEVYFEWLRTQLNLLADVVFIDARTGVTEMGGVCTYQMADMIVMLCAANQQNMDGTQQMLESFSSPQLPPLRHDRELKVLVVPARIERVAEIQTLNRFRQEFAKRFLPYVNQISNQPDILVKLEIPYVPLYAFEEIIAVRQTSDELRSVEMEAAYSQLAQILIQDPVRSQMGSGLSKYLDIDITIASQSDNRYIITVRSQAGEANSIVAFPFTATELESNLLKTENAILSSATEGGSSSVREEAAVQVFGEKLFGFLLDGELRSFYYESQRLASFEGKRTRIKLSVLAPELATVPWEFLYDPRRRDYICLDPQTSLIRYTELPLTSQQLQVTPPLRILGIAVSPSDLQPVDVDLKKTALELALHNLQMQGLVELTWLSGNTWRDLQRSMRSLTESWHILHFIGRGGFDEHRNEGTVFLADEKGHAAPLYATQLARVLARHRNTLRLVLLNVCEIEHSGRQDLFSSIASTLVVSGIPAVLTMQYEITDEAAIDFSRTFYESLVDNLPVDTALAEARNAMTLENSYSLEWGIPVLYMRASDGALFDIAGSPNHTTTVGSLLPEPRPSASDSRYPSIKLRNLLCELYSDKEDILRLLYDAGINPDYINIDGKAINIWHQIMIEAERTDRMNALLNVVSLDYAVNDEFFIAAALYRNEQARRKKD